MKVIKNISQLVGEGLGQSRMWSLQQRLVNKITSNHRIESKLL